MKKILGLLSVVFVAFCFGHSAKAATRYVATSGSDSSNTCLNSNTPCASLSRCVAQMASGDTCTVADGVYTDPALAKTALSCGTGTNVCTIKATNKHGAVLVFTAAGGVQGNGGAAIWIDHNNWVVDGFKVLMNYQRPFVYGDGSTGLTFKNNRVEISPYAGEAALYVLGTGNITIEDNWVHHFPGCVNDAVQCSAGGYSSCDFVENPPGPSYLGNEFSVDGYGSSNLVFQRNDFGHMRNPISFRNISNITVRKNKCVNATNHGCWEMDDVDNVLVENNIADIDTSEGCLDGSEVYQSSLWDSYCAANVTIRNNTVVGRGLAWEQELVNNAPNAGAASSCGDAAAPNVCTNGGCYQGFKVYNNIVYDGKPGSQPIGLGLSSSAGYGGSNPKWRSDYNMFYEPSGRCIAAFSNSRYCSLPTWQSFDLDADGISEDPHSLAVAPLFISYAGHDLSPASASAPQVNAGANGVVNGISMTCPTDDFNGNARSDGNCDIGALEYQGTGASGDTQAPTVPTNLTTTISISGIIRSIVIAFIDTFSRLLSWR